MEPSDDSVQEIKEWVATETHAGCCKERKVLNRRGPNWFLLYVIGIASLLGGCSFPMTKVGMKFGAETADFRGYQSATKKGDQVTLTYSTDVPDTRAATVDLEQLAWSDTLDIRGRVQQIERREAASKNTPSGEPLALVLHNFYCPRDVETIHASRAGENGVSAHIAYRNVRVVFARRRENDSDTVEYAVAAVPFREDYTDSEKVPFRVITVPMGFIVDVILQPLYLFFPEW